MEKLHIRNCEHDAMLFQPVNDLLASRPGEGSGPNCTSAHALGIDSTG